MHFRSKEADHLTDEPLPHNTVFSELKRLIQIWRESLPQQQSIFALHNISDEPQTISR